MHPTALSPSCHPVRTLLSTLIYSYEVIVYSIVDAEVLGTTNQFFRFVSVQMISALLAESNGFDLSIL